MGRLASGSVGQRYDHNRAAWIMHPSVDELIPGDPLQIDVRARDTDIWIVMVLGQGMPPRARITGTGMGSILCVGPHRISLDKQSERITVREQSL